MTPSPLSLHVVHWKREELKTKKQNKTISLKRDLSFVFEKQNRTNQKRCERMHGKIFFVAVPSFPLNSTVTAVRFFLWNTLGFSFLESTFMRPSCVLILLSLTTCERTHYCWIGFTPLFRNRIQTIPTRSRFCNCIRGGMKNITMFKKTDERSYTTCTHLN